MHELSLMANLMRKIEDTARQSGGVIVTRVRLRFGALAHTSPEHFREHFERASQGTLAEGAVLEIVHSNDLTDAHAQDILLESVEIGE
jgi:hydrogenase nickel incorporation protein HypA/HybF